MARMFTVTKAAAKQIRRSAASSDTEELALRIAASRTGDGGIDYRMGFDDVGVDDALLSTNGVDVVIAAADKTLLNGTVLDYVEIEPGDHRFIFLNPNDPHHRPPAE
jgi:iron-sulfur cluster assembly protein